MPTYAEHRVAALPAWLAGPHDVAFQEAIGEAMDEDIVERGRQAVKCGFIADCPDDALQAHGTMSGGIEQGPNEPAATFRARLLGRWDTWAEAGLFASIETALAVYEATATVYSRRSGFDDGNTWSWTRFEVWFAEDEHPWDWLPAEDATIAGAETMCGSTMTISEYRTLRRVVNKWRSGTELGLQFVLVYSGPVAGPPTIAGPTTFAKNAGSGCRLPIGRFAQYGGAKPAGQNTICGYYF